MFLGGRIIDERLERRVLGGSFGGGVAGDVDPFLDEVEDGVEGFLVLRILLCALRNLHKEKE